MKSVTVYTCNVGPILQRSCFIPKGDPNVRTFIPGLFRVGGPTTVFWTVVSVVVFAFNTVVFRWFKTHVRQEGFKTVTPLGADRNPSPPIILEHFGFGIGATLDHRLPRRVFGQMEMVQAMLVLVGVLVTATTLCFSVAQMAAPDHGFLPASAETAPVKGFVLVFTGKTEDGQLSKGFADHGDAGIRLTGCI